MGYIGYIYGLFDECTGLALDQCRYVGQTGKSLPERLSEHITNARMGKRSHVYNWIRRVEREGAQPIILLIESVKAESEEELFILLDDAERNWIAKGRAEGWALTNQTDGGGGVRGYRHTEETRARISDSLTGRKMPPRSEEWRRKRSEAMKGRKQSPELVEKRVAHQRGKKRSHETRAKIGEANRRRGQTEATRQKLSEQRQGIAPVEAIAANTGRPLSEIHRQHISEAGKAREMTPEWLKQITVLGNASPSDDTKAKMAEAQRNNRVRCLECGRIANGGGIALHQKASGHQGKEHISSKDS